MENIKDILANNIKYLRAKAGYTQDYVANEVGIEPVTYRYYESGRRFPKPQYLEALAKALHTEVSELFRSEPAQKKPVDSVGLFNVAAKNIELLELLAQAPEGDSIGSDLVGLVKARLESHEDRSAKKDHA